MELIPIAYSDRFVLELPEGHRFPMIKYELIKEQLLHEGTIEATQLTDPGLIDEDIILATHDFSYWKSLKNLDLDARAFRKIGFPPSERLIKRSRSSSMGTLHAALGALNKGIGYNTAGGTHHAYTNKGEGFCLLNDIGITSNYLLNNKLAKQILVVDLDVHQGNGTAEIFQNNPKVFTLSIHGKDNYPLHKEKSDLDIEIPSFTKDNEYLPIVKETVHKLIEKQQPDFIFYQAGVDVLETDKLGKLSLSREGCKQRDEIVLESCYKNGIPVAVSMGGGYSERLVDIVEAHCNTFRVGHDIFG